MQKKSISKDLRVLMRQVSADKKFAQTPAAKIAEHFRLRRKQAGYVMRRHQWEKTMLWAERVLVDEDYIHVSTEDWLACIDWCFDVAPVVAGFWSEKKVQFTSFKTCEAAYNDFHTWRETQRKEESPNRIQYGKM